MKCREESSLSSSIALVQYRPLPRYPPTGDAADHRTTHLPLGAQSTRHHLHPPPDHQREPSPPHRPWRFEPPSPTCISTIALPPAHLRPVPQASTTAVNLRQPPLPLFGKNPPTSPVQVTYWKLFFLFFM
ncbi:hypothetical protein U1Q18_033747 [Sarracenia purpurea var. burkii]